MTDIIQFTEDNALAIGTTLLVAFIFLMPHLARWAIRHDGEEW